MLLVNGRHATKVEREALDCIPGESLNPDSVYSQISQLSSSHCCSNLLTFCQYRTVDFDFNILVYLIMEAEKL